MTLQATLSLIGVIIIFAAIPGPGIIGVVSRSLNLGLKHAFFMVLGIATGDLMYLLCSLFGLAFVIKAYAWFFTAIKYAGGAYLFYLGVSSIIAQTKSNNLITTKAKTLKKSYLSGFALSSSNPKVILFYLGLLPAFVDLSAMTLPLALHIIFSIIPFIIIVLFVYGIVASKAKNFFKDEKTLNKINIASGILMCGLGLFVIFGL